MGCTLVKMLTFMDDPLQVKWLKFNETMSWLCNSLVDNYASYRSLSLSYIVFIYIDILLCGIILSSHPARLAMVLCESHSKIIDMFLDV